ncbi:MAG: FMN-binding protein [Clostridia bacterium]|nr:FMN-binding protein [Clostridia bacterium]
MSKIKEFAVPTIVLFIICFVAAALLGVTNKVTAPKIEEINKKNQQEAMQAVMADAVSFDDEQTADDENSATYAAAYDADGNVIGYAITATGEVGYGDVVKMMVGIDTEGKVTTVKNLENSETASLGGKILKEGTDFLKRFMGTDDAMAVDAVSGATRTSNATKTAVNNAIECYKNIAEGGTK